LVLVLCGGLSEINRPIGAFLSRMWAAREPHDRQTCRAHHHDHVAGFHGSVDVQPEEFDVRRQDATTRRRILVDQYVAAFRKVEVAAQGDAKGALAELEANVSAWVVPDKQADLRTLVDARISKLS